MWPFIPGERFPYTNFHAMNQDWIIAVVKDFQEKYNHVQQLIDNGVDTLNQELQTAQRELEATETALLNALNTWYSTHQNYLDEELASNIATFNTQAETKAQQTIASIPSDYSTLSAEAVKGNYVWDHSRLTTYPTANDLPVQSTFIGNFTNNDFDTLNLPSRTDYALDASVFFVQTIGISASLTAQIATFGHKSLGRQFIRTKVYGTWNQWILVSDRGYVWNTASHARYTTADALPAQTTFIGNLVNPDYDTSHLPPRVPYNLDASLFLISTDGNSVLMFQTAIFGNNGTAKIFTRTRISGSWTAWKPIMGGDIYIIDKAGSGNNTSLVAGIIEAYEAEFKYIKILAGTYDMVSEYRALYGDDWETDILNSAYSGGLPIGNGMVLDFSPGAQVTFDYSNYRNATINNTTSAFIAKGGDFEINGLNLACKNIRYCIHDEMNSNGEYKHVYNNCKMSMIDDANTSWKSCQCIGGGMGKSGNIEIRNCLFYSDNNGANAGIGAVSFHNGAAAGIQSFVSIIGCYFDGNNGTIRASWYGVSTLISEVLASGNSFKIAPIYRAETQDSNIQNIKLTAFNNEVR